MDVYATNVTISAIAAEKHRHNTLTFTYTLRRVQSHLNFHSHSWGFRYLHVLTQCENSLSLVSFIENDLITGERFHTICI